MNKTYQIDGMTCQSCVQKVSEALKGLAEKVEITLRACSKSF